MKDSQGPIKENSEVPGAFQNGAPDRPIDNDEIPHEEYPLVPSNGIPTKPINTEEMPQEEYPLLPSNGIPNRLEDRDEIPQEDQPLLPSAGLRPTIVPSGDNKKDKKSLSKDLADIPSKDKDQKNKDDKDGEDEEEVILTPEMELEILGPEQYTQGGWGFCVGKHIQKLACPQFYIVMFSTVMLSQSMYFYYANGTISTIEKRFRLPSKTTGFISTGNDILQMALALHVAHICGNGHRPRWMALGMVFITAASALTALPHAIFGAGTYSELAQSPNITGTPTKEKGWFKCGDTNTVTQEECEEKSSEIGTEQVVVIVLQFVGQLITGLGQTVVGVTGMSYMDDSIAKEKLPLYFGIAGAMRIFGPVGAYSMASWALRQWVEIGVKPSITPSHPHWVGAWWIGYLVIAAIALFPTWGLLLLPRQMPATRARVQERLRAAARKGKTTFTEYRAKLRPSTMPKMREMLSGIKRLLKNRFFMAITANMLIFYFCLVGYMVFSSKYIENNFMISAAEANQYIALVGLVASLVGWLGTGSLLTYLKPSTKHIMYITLSVSVFSSAAYIYMMTLRCEQQDVVGLDQVLISRGKQHIPSPESLENQYPKLSTCMDDCGCTSRFSPVCVDGEHTFFSACHAGCSQRQKENNTNMYEECSCIDHLQLKPNKTMDASSIVDGRCEPECSAFWWYLGIVMISKVLQIAQRNISHCLFLRSMDEKDKDLALGLATALMSFCFIIGPIIIGAIIDYSCILWEWTCGRQGFCWLYDLDTYAATLHGIPAAGLVLCFVTELMMLKWRKDIDFFGDREKAALGLQDILGGKEEEEDKPKKRTKEPKEKEAIKMV